MAMITTATTRDNIAAAIITVIAAGMIGVTVTASTAMAMAAVADINPLTFTEMEPGGS